MQEEFNKNQKKVYSRPAHLSPNMQRDIYSLTTQAKRLLAFGGLALVFAFLNWKFAFEIIEHPAVEIMVLFLLFIFIPGISLTVKACAQIRRAIVAYRSNQLAEIKASLLHVGCFIGAVFAIAAAVLFVVGFVLVFVHWLRSSVIM